MLLPLEPDPVLWNPDAWPLQSLRKRPGQTTLHAGPNGVTRTPGSWRAQRLRLFGRPRRLPVVATSHHGRLPYLVFAPRIFPGLVVGIWADCGHHERRGRLAPPSLRRRWLASRSTLLSLVRRYLERSPDGRATCEFDGARSTHPSAVPCDARKPASPRRHLAQVCSRRTTRYDLFRRSSVSPPEKLNEKKNKMKASLSKFQGL